MRAERELSTLRSADTPRTQKSMEVLRDIEREWRAELGPKDFAQLKELLCRVWGSPLIREATCFRSPLISDKPE